MAICMMIRGSIMKKRCAYTYRYICNYTFDNTKYVCIYKQIYVLHVYVIGDGNGSWVNDKK